VEEGENGLTGYEIKISKTKVQSPKLWKDEYNGGFQLINRSNYIEWLLDEMR
jgi:hypothetical protein